MLITDRDYELLRTLVRLQVATTATLRHLLFSDMKKARRRLRVLRADYGLIATHSNGLPGTLSAEDGQFWRLTPAGLRQYIKRYCETTVPENHIRRSRTGSLRFHEHRNAINDMYVRLLKPEEAAGDIEVLALRAEAVVWRGEQEVVLPYTTLAGGRSKERNVVPDATLTTGDTRFFLEVDRSTETRMRCKKQLQGYAAAMRRGSFESLFPDKLPTVVVYTTRTAARAKNLSNLMASLPELPFRAVAMPQAEAGAWLAAAITTHPAPLFDSKEMLVELERALRNIYGSCCLALKDLPTGSAPPPYAEDVQGAYAVLQKVRSA